MKDVKRLLRDATSWVKSQPQYVLYGAGCIFIGVVFIIVGIILL